MRFQSSVVVEALQGLERQFGTPRGHLVQVASLVSGGQFEAAREAADKVLRALDVVIATKVRLHANVVPVDDLGQSIESLGELAFRARRMVIVTQLDHLCNVLREPAAQERARCWFVGRFQGIGDVATFFRDELSRINRMWTQYREGNEHAAGIIVFRILTLAVKKSFPPRAMPTWPFAPIDESLLKLMYWSMYWSDS